MGQCDVRNLHQSSYVMCRFSSELSQGLSVSYRYCLFHFDFAICSKIIQDHEQDHVCFTITRLPSIGASQCLPLCMFTSAPWSIRYCTTAGLEATHAHSSGGQLFFSSWFTDIPAVAKKENRHLFVCLFVGLFVGIWERVDVEAIWHPGEQRSHFAT